MMTVREILQNKCRDIYSVTPQTPVFEALKIMADRNIGAVLVIEGEKLAGIFSERDYARKLSMEHEFSKNTTVRELMVSDVLCIGPEKTVEDCMMLMTSRHIRHLPVMDNKKLLGIISINDAVKTIIRGHEFEISGLKISYESIMEAWAHSIDLREKQREGHNQRVTAIFIRLAHKMGIKEESLVNMRKGALLHDIGKMCVPDSILLKPGPLTEEEMAVIKQHPFYAYNLLYPIENLRPALDIPYCHHEKWDGSGYPRGLKGEEIPLAARIFAVVDEWDILCSDRPFRNDWSEDKTRKHLKSLAGSHFDPRVVEMFLETKW